MNVIFCEECGGKNLVSPEQLEELKTKPPKCTICGNVMTLETIIDHGAHGGPIDTAQYHLLFIEDDPLYQELLTSVLGGMYNLSIASTGEEGLALAESVMPDLILLDINLPNIDGYEVCRRLKNQSNLRRIPVLFVTSMSDKGMEARGLSIGAVDYIIKPFQKDVLFARIDQQLKIKQLLERQKHQQDRLEKLLNQVSLAADVEQEKLRQEKENFYYIMNNLKEMITVQDADKRLVWANQTVLDFYDVKLSEIAGTPCHELYLGKQEVCSGCPADTDISGSFNTPLTMERENFPPLQQTHIPLLDNEGNMTGVAHVVTEMTAWLI